MLVGYYLVSGWIPAYSKYHEIKYHKYREIKYHNYPEIKYHKDPEIKLSNPSNGFYDGFLMDFSLEGSQNVREGQFFTDTNQVLL